MAIKLKSASSKSAVTRKSSSTSKSASARPKANAGTKRNQARGGAKTNSRGTKTTSTRNSAKSTPAKTSTRRSPKTDMTQAQLKKILNPLSSVAKKRDKHHDDWKEAVADANEKILAALEAGVPVNLVIEHGNISRQHCYKLIDQAKKGQRSNGSKPATTKRAPKPKPGRKTTAAKKPAAKKTGTKRRIKAKA